MNLESIKFELTKSDVPIDPIEQFTHLLRKEHEAGRLSFAVCMAHAFWRSTFQKVRWPQVIAADDWTEERLNEFVDLAIRGDVLLIGVETSLSDLACSVSALSFAEEGRAPLFSSSPFTPWMTQLTPGYVDKSKELKDALDVAAQMAKCCYLYTEHDIQAVYAIGRTQGTDLHSE